MKMQRCLVAMSVLAASYAPVAVFAADEVPPTNEAAPAVSVGKDGEVQLNLQFGEIKIVDLLALIASRGNLEIVVDGAVDGQATDIRLDNIKPEYALQQICKSQKLSCVLSNKTYFINTQTAEKPAKIIESGVDTVISLEFKDIGLTELLELISTNFGVRVAFDDSVDAKARIGFIRLRNETLNGTVRKIAQATKLNIERQGDNTYLLSQAPAAK